MKWYSYCRTPCSCHSLLHFMSKPTVYARCVAIRVVASCRSRPTKSDGCSSRHRFVFSQNCANTSTTSSMEGSAISKGELNLREGLRLQLIHVSRLLTLQVAHPHSLSTLEGVPRSPISSLAHSRPEEAHSGHGPCP